MASSPRPATKPFVALTDRPKIPAQAIYLRFRRSDKWNEFFFIYDFVSKVSVSSSASRVCSGNCSLGRGGSVAACRIVTAVILRVM